MTHEEMLSALTVERFGTRGVLRAERHESPAESEWRRLKDLAKALKEAEPKRRKIA